MGRTCIRTRSDGVHEIVRRGRAKKVALAVGAVALGMALLLAAAVALAVSLAFALPLVLCGGGYLLARHLRRGAGRTDGVEASSSSPPSGRGPLRAIQGGVRGTPVPRLSPFASPQAGRGPARDAGA